MVRFEVEGDPVSTNRMYRRGTVSPHLTGEAITWKEWVAWRAFIDCGRRPVEGDVELTIIYHHRYPGRRLDNDNVVKLVQDALQGLAYHNDKQIARLVVERHHDPERPRLEVTVRRL